MVRRAVAALLLGLGWLFAIAAAGVPSLPAPDGPFAVGVRQVELAAAAGRIAPATIWYPAADSRAATRPYLSAADAAVQATSLARNFGYAPDSIAAMTTARAHSTVDASPLRARRKFPILIFSHGFLLYPAQNTALLERLASHGYIVVSIAHPGDAVDLRLNDGTVVPQTVATDPDTRFPAAMATISAGKDDDARTAGFHDYADAFAVTRLGRSMAMWRDDTVAVATAVVAGTVPGPLRAVLAQGDTRRLGLVGMSFGGATAATSCRLIAACRVAVNLDGQNFDPALFDHAVERPLLLLLSDWTHYPLFAGQSPDEAFSPNDYAYEAWAKAGLDPDVLRVRVDGMRHLGFTDLIALMSGPERDARVGAIGAVRAFAATDDLVLAFLDRHLVGGDPAAIDRAIAANPELHRHDPAQLRAWATGRKALSPPGRGS